MEQKLCTNRDPFLLRVAEAYPSKASSKGRGIVFAGLHKLIAGRGDGTDAQLSGALAELAQGWSYQAFETLSSLAQGGNSEAQFQLGQIYESATGVVQNLADAVHWYRGAAEQGHALAQSRLGLIYYIEPPSAAGIAREEPQAVPSGVVDSGENHGELRARRSRLGATFEESFPHGFAVEQDLAEAARWNLLAADAGVAEAQARYGHQLAQGLGVTRDLPKAVRYFHAAAKQNNSAAQTGLGVLLAGGFGGTPRFAAAREWLEPAARSGNASAQYWLGHIRLQLVEESDRSEADEAISLLRRAAEQGQGSAMYRLGLAYWSGEAGTPDLSAGETWLRRAASKGIVAAMRGLGQILLEQPETDGVEAASWFRQAAESGDRRAAAALAELYLHGRGTPADPVEAARWLVVAGSEARLEAHILLAACYAKGVGVDASHSAAARWLSVAAQRGSVSAKYNLGSMHRQGMGVRQDPSEAAAWYREAAIAGSAQAAFYLGLLHSEDGPLQDSPKAARWFRSAMRGGHSLALCNLALMMIQGRGISPNLARGLRLLEGGAEGGCVDAAELLVDLYANGEHIVASPQHVESCLGRAVRLGSSAAACLMADGHLDGFAWSWDRKRVCAILESGANSGDPVCQRVLGRLLHRGGECHPDDLAKAHAYLSAAAETGDAESQVWMGDSSRLGWVGSVDRVRAEDWYRKAAGQGDATALVRLALLLEESSSPGTESECFGLWLAAASRGSVIAQRSVALYYLDGRGCEPYPSAAVRWIKLAAGSGDGEARYRLGCCYRDGIGVVKDTERARFWIESAVREGFVVPNNESSSRS